ncbi:MAG: MFS transporter [Solirubrobacteraceae bacterium]
MSNPPADARRLHRGRFVAGCALGFAVSWNISNTGAVAPLLAAHYHASLGPVGGLAATPFLGEVVIMIPGGRAIDRFGARVTGSLSLALVVAGSALLLAPGGIALALAARVIVGLGVGVGFVTGAVLVQSAAADHSTLAQGLYGGLSLSGGGLALAIVPQLTGWLDWRAPYVSAIAVALIGLAGPALAGAPARHPAAAGVSLRALLADPRLTVLGIVSASSFGLSVIIGNWVVALVEHTAGASAGAAGAIAALTLLVGIVGRPLGGALAHGHLRRTRAILVCAALLGALGAALLAVTSATVPAIVGAGAIGLAGGLPFGTAMSGAARTHPEAPGVAVSVMNLYPVVTIVAGAPLVGLAFALPGSGRAGFVIVAALWLASAVAAAPAAALASTRPG